MYKNELIPNKPHVHNSILDTLFNIEPNVFSAVTTIYEIFIHYAQTYIKRDKVIAPHGAVVRPHTLDNCDIVHYEMEREENPTPDHMIEVVKENIRKIDKEVGIIAGGIVDMFDLNFNDGRKQKIVLIHIVHKSGFCQRSIIPYTLTGIRKKNRVFEWHFDKATHTRNGKEQSGDSPVENFVWRGIR